MERATGSKCRQRLLPSCLPDAAQMVSHSHCGQDHHAYGFHSKQGMSMHYSQGEGTRWSEAAALTEHDVRAEGKLGIDEFLQGGLVSDAQDALQLPVACSNRAQITGSR
mgnify:CR=1 FL=1